MKEIKPVDNIEVINSIEIKKAEPIENTSLLLTRNEATRNEATRERIQPLLPITGLLITESDNIVKHIE
jgi:hypothetical protein